MKPLHVHIRSNNNGSDWIEPVLSILRKGGVLVYPTETVYGLGGDAQSDAVAERIHRLKKRTIRKPFLALIPDSGAIFFYTEHVSPSAKMLMDRFWPGPLTLIFKVTASFPKLLLGEGNTLGVRVSSDPVCRILLNRFERPLISTSANPEGNPPARTAADVVSFFREDIDAVLDDGPRTDAVPSTVLDVTGGTPLLLRHGAVSKEAIVDAIGEIHEE